MEDSISHTDAPNAFKSNQLNELGQKIFLDRYALKDVSKRTLSVGDMVIVCVDDKTGQREIAIVRSMEGNRVTVELQDSTTLDRLIEHVSKPIETAPEQMMERVARGIAAVEGEQAEDWYHKFRWLLDGWKFVPAGRILTAAGTDQQLTFYNCMPPDQEVLTADGYKPIAEVSVGEMVVTHRNRLRRVLHKFERETEEPIYTIKAKKLGYDDLRVTGEHKILAIRSEWVNAHKSRDGLKLQQEPQWIPARELKPGDYLAAAYDGEQEPVAPIYISEHVSGYQVAAGKLFKPQKRSDYHGHLEEGGTRYEVNDRLVVDHDLCYLFGRWLGDGCVTHRTKTDIPSGIKIVFGLDEREEAERIACIIEEKFNVPASIKMSSTERWLDLWANSMPLGQFFKAFFGCYSYGKHIPSKLMRLPDDLMIELLKGLFTADGYISGDWLGILLSNRTLATQTHQMLMRLGYFFSIKENTHRLGRRPAYRVTARASECGDLFNRFFDTQPQPHETSFKSYLEHDDLRWVRISEISIEDYSGVVLDMEVEEDHSFVSAGLVLSNCYVVPSPKDSRRGIVETLSQMMEIMSRGGGVGINVSSLRPRHSYVKGVNGRSSGSVSWGALYSFVTGLIEQGGCLTPDTMVFTEEGLLRLDEIVRHEEKGWRDQNLVVMTDEGQRASRHTFNNGVADVLTVSTDMGIELTGTPNHKVKVMTDRGQQWKQLSELQRGDAIMIKLDQHAGKQQELKKPDIKHHNQDAVELPDVLDEDLAFFLGYMAGDGFMTAREGDWRLGVAVSHDSYLIEEMPALIERLFRGTHVRVQQKENDASLNYIISNRAVKEFLIINGLAKTRSSEASIPRLIRQSPPEVVAAFLRGLLEADGSVSHGYPMLTSASKRLIDESATLLIGLGCPVKVEAQPSGKDHYGDKQIWRLRVHSFKGLENWKAKIGCDPRSRFAVCSDFDPDLTREVSYRLPHPQHWIEPVLSATALPQINHRATGQHIKAIDPALRRKLLRYLRGDRNLTLSAYAALARSHASFSEHARPIDDTWFVYVKSVRKAGQSLTLDLEVDDNHTYIANGMVTHNSRRGALMLILNCWHPDVLEFINSKRDMGKITNANISVGITDKFMEAVHQDADWELVFPDTSDPDYETSWDGNLEKWIAAGKKINVYNTVKARAVWNSIIESAWASAEPGVFFIERANKMSNSWYYDAGYLGCTNPCVTGDTLVSTPDGWKRADSIKEGDYIATVLGSGVVETVEAHESVPVFKVTLSDGAVLRVTAAHRFQAIKRQERGGNNANKHFSQIRLDHLQAGDYIRIAPALMPDNPVPGKPALWLDREYGFMLGVLLGDGCYTENSLARNTENSLARNTVTVACDARENEWIDIVESFMLHAGSPAVNRYQNRDGKGRITNSLSLSSQAKHGLAEFVAGTLLKPAYSAEKDVPLEYINTNREFLAGLIDGLWSTDGNVNLKSSHPLLRFKTSSEKLAQSVRRTLLMFGIHGRIVKGTRSYHEIDGRPIKDTQPFYELIISGAGVKAFAEQIGITHPAKAEKLKQAQLDFSLTGNTWLAHIVSIEPDGEEAVYDLYEPQSDTWITDGVVNMGCGEQPLPGFGVCNLGAINLSKFVSDGDVAWDDLGEAVRYSVRFLDNVIDATPYFFDENFAQQKSERRVGLNTMGLAEMLIRLGIRYGSDESVTFIERLYLFIATESYRASSEIAAEKGSFPAFDADKFLQSGYMQMMPEEIRQMAREKGMRNVTLLTQAPNGTIGTMVGTSTGIEPFYFWSYYRKSRLGQHEERVGVMEEWQQSHPKEELPQFFVTAMDLAPEEHVKVQAAIQRWVDSSISKCVTGDTLVLTANGLMPIEEISDMRQPDEFQSLEIEVITPSGIEKTDAFYYGGMRETRRVSLSFGYEIEGTLNHRVHVLNPDGSIGFARFDDLAIGDTVVLYSGQKIFGPDSQTLAVYSGAWNTNAKSIRFPEKMSPELAYVLGCITSEGCIAQNFVSISNSDRSLLEKLSALFEELFDLESSIYEDKRRERLFSLQVNSRPLKNWLLNDLGLEAGAENKIIPSCILRASREEIEAFLRGLMLDAYMTLDGRMFGIGLATRKLIRQLQTLLLNFGVLSRMHRSAERAWALTVAGDSLDILATFIEFDDAWKAERLARRNEGRTIKRLNYSELMPSHLTAELRISQLSSSKSLRSLYRGDTPEYQRARISLNRGSRLSRETASLLHEHFDDVGSDYADRFFEKDQSGCVYIQVEAVERRVAEVFDLSVPGSHTFIANGLGNHNTCNLPSSYTVDQTREVYELLYRLGCKGGTIYRDGSRDVQVLNLKEEDKRVSEKAREETEAKIATDDSSEMVKSNGGLQPKVRPRPYKRRGYTVSKATPSGTAHITMNEDEEGQPFEVFLEIGKAGSDIKAMAEAMGRLMSLILRMASPVSPIERVSEIVKQITGIGGARSYGFGKRRVLSLPDAVGQALAENYMGVTSGSEEAGQGAEMGVENAGAATKQKEIAMHSASADLCPHCGDSAFVRIEGCQTCYACGYSEC